MSILKGILHHWNKTNSAYDTIHPETEVAQVTDWNQGIVNTLASTGLSSLVNVLSSDSLLALLIKKVFDAAGVKYSTGQNGYVCLGNFFGSVIVQWGVAGRADLGVTFPFAFSQLFAVMPVWATGGTGQAYAWTINTYSTTGFTVYQQGRAIGVFYIAIGM